MGRRHDESTIFVPLTAFQIEDYSHREIGETRLPGMDAAVIDEVGALERAGVTVTQVVPLRTASLTHLLDWMEWFGQEVVRRFRTATT